MNAIQEYREKHGTKYADLAAMLDVSPGLVGDILAGRRPITTRTAMKFAKAIGKPDQWRKYVDEPEGV